MQILSLKGMLKNSTVSQGSHSQEIQNICVHCTLFAIKAWTISWVPKLNFAWWLTPWHITKITHRLWATGLRTGSLTYPPSTVNNRLWENLDAKFILALRRKNTFWNVHPVLYNHPSDLIFCLVNLPTRQTLLTTTSIKLSKGLVSHFLRAKANISKISISSLTPARSLEDCERIMVLLARRARDAALLPYLPPSRPVWHPRISATLWVPFT